MDTQLPLRQELVIIILDMPEKELNGRRRRPTKQVEGAPPIVENSKLPKMTDKRATAATRPKRIRGKILRMPTNPTQKKGGRNRMHPMPTKLTITEATDHEYSTQEEKKEEGKRRRKSS
jgi:hypothetical protein